MKLAENMNHICCHNFAPISSNDVRDIKKASKKACPEIQAMFRVCGGSNQPAPVLLFEYKHTVLDESLSLLFCRSSHSFPLFRCCPLVIPLFSCALRLLFTIMLVLSRYSRAARTHSFAVFPMLSCGSPLFCHPSRCFPTLPLAACVLLSRGSSAAFPLLSHCSLPLSSFR